MARSERKDGAAYGTARGPLHYDCGRPSRLEVKTKQGIVAHKVIFTWKWWRATIAALLLPSGVCALALGQTPESPKRLPSQPANQEIVSQQEAASEAEAEL